MDKILIILAVLCSNICFGQKTIDDQTINIRGFCRKEITVYGCSFKRRYINN